MKEASIAKDEFALKTSGQDSHGAPAAKESVHMRIWTTTGENAQSAWHGGCGAASAMAAPNGIWGRAYGFARHMER